MERYFTPVFVNLNSFIIRWEMKKIEIQGYKINSKPISINAIYQRFNRCKW
ncbi:hypothetical protein CCAND95_620024 [Capnocytophaga canis]|uniref:Uncharacterized protein n=1 Tax=Capnocytophaga canis TaxID=1848903 RepID=A0A0B7IF59_9FLAO|nr:hypothetical protein CCAND95_620024 [Capnocytophaga canis]CEN48637.1 hypothetical protein CCAND38_610024 [Capnocytophaga canis]CEN53685.1 hypothetical protein CCAND93_510026 [Capnocytophaga canis]